VLLPNLMYRSDGAGGFQDVTEAGGFGNLQKGHGIAFGDLDNDGDQDVYAQIGGMYPYDDYFNSLFLNPGHGNRFLTLELVGTESNRDALGSRITLTLSGGDGPRKIVRWVWPRGSFGSGTLRQEIGVGSAETVDAVEVWWPRTDGTQRFENLETNAFWRLTEGDASPERLERAPVELSVDGGHAGHDHAGHDHAGHAHR
ncbi:MAG TPA: CRTAC1 family protein, partial [bacterium]|nr:CRTAC1 family protein [bacterium]